MDQGVPQGSLLGPTCYSIHENDLPDAVEQPFKDNPTDSRNCAEMFADDTTAFCIAENIDQLTPKIQEISSRLQNWSTLNGMVIHPGKTKVMILSKKKIVGPIQNITMSGRSLEIVDCHKVLGITIDKNLVWKKQLEKVLKHFRTKIKMLKRMSVLGKEVLTKFYYSTIIPSVLYNITVWGNNCTAISKLDELHAKAAKLIYGLPQHMSNIDAILAVGWTTIQYLYKRRVLCLMLKIFYQKIDPQIISMFTTLEIRHYIEETIRLQYQANTPLTTKMHLLRGPRKFGMPCLMLLQKSSLTTNLD